VIFIANLLLLHVQIGVALHELAFFSLFRQEFFSSYEQLEISWETKKHNMENQKKFQQRNSDSMPLPMGSRRTYSAKSAASTALFPAVISKPANDSFSLPEILGKLQKKA